MPGFRSPISSVSSYNYNRNQNSPLDQDTAAKSIKPDDPQQNPTGIKSILKKSSTPVIPVVKVTPDEVDATPPRPKLSSQLSRMSRSSLDDPASNPAHQDFRPKASTPAKERDLSVRPKLFNDLHQSRSRDTSSDSDSDESPVQRHQARPQPGPILLRRPESFDAAVATRLDGSEPAKYADLSNKIM